MLILFDNYSILILNYRILFKLKTNVCFFLQGEVLGNDVTLTS